MTKRIAAKTGTYQKEGETKGRYVDLGVILSNENGEYVLLDPTVNLAGVLARQNIMAAADGKQQRDSVMCSIFDNDRSQQAPQQGYKHDNPTTGKAEQPAPSNDFDQSIPF